MKLEMLDEKIMKTVVTQSAPGMAAVKVSTLPLYLGSKGYELVSQNQLCTAGQSNQ